MLGTDYFIGCVTQATPDALDYMSMPDVPSSYKSQEAIRGFERREQDKFLDRAPLMPLTGTLRSACVLDAGGDTVLAIDSDEPGEASCRLVDWLQGFDNYPFTVGSSFTPARYLWGFDVDLALRIVGLETLRYGSAMGRKFLPPLRMWYSNNGARDPYDMMLGSTERRTMSLISLCKYLGVSITPGDLDPNSPGAAWRLALTARTLCQRSGLVPI